MGFSRQTLSDGRGYIWTRGGGSLWIKVETPSGEKVDLGEEDLLPLFEEWATARLINKLENGDLGMMLEWLKRSGEA